MERRTRRGTPLTRMGDVARGRLFQVGCVMTRRHPATAHGAGPSSSRTPGHASGRRGRGVRPQLAEAGALGAAIDQVPDALILADADGRVLHLNAAAERLLASGGPLRWREGRLTCGRRACGNALRQAIEAAGDPRSPAATTMLLSNHGRARLILGVSPLTSAGDTSIALIVVNEAFLPSRRHVEPLKSLFSLTRAEADVALRVADGATPAEIGRQRGVALNTVRGQMKSLAGKMGCARQVEIAALVRAIPVPPPGSREGRDSVVSLSM